MRVGSRVHLEQPSDFYHRPRGWSFHGGKPSFLRPLMFGLPRIRQRSGHLLRASLRIASAKPSPFGGTTSNLTRIRRHQTTRGGLSFICPTPTGNSPPFSWRGTGASSCRRRCLWGRTCSACLELSLRRLGGGSCSKGSTTSSARGLHGGPHRPRLGQTKFSGFPWSSRVDRV